MSSKEETGFITPKFLVQIECMTFNHSQYINDAMEGFVKQQTSFPYIAVIIDDASTDGEQEVILDYFKSNFEPETIINKETKNAIFYYGRHNTNENCFFSIVLLKYNHYSQKLDKTQYLAEWGGDSKYIAYCEGDDYWLVDNKLQRQVCLLNDNNHVGLVYGCAKTFIQEHKSFGKSIGKSCNGNRDLIYENVIHTPTVMVRRNALDGYSDIEKAEWLMGDYPRWMYILNNSESLFINNKLSVYRILPESASHSKDYKKAIAFEDSNLDIKLTFSENME